MDAESANTQFSATKKRGRRNAPATAHQHASQGDDDDDDNVAIVLKRPPTAPASGRPVAAQPAHACPVHASAATAKPSSRPASVQPAHAASSVAVHPVRLQPAPGGGARPAHASTSPVAEPLLDEPVVGHTQPERAKNARGESMGVCTLETRNLVGGKGETNTMGDCGDGHSAVHATGGGTSEQCGDKARAGRPATITSLGPGKVGTGTAATRGKPRVATGPSTLPVRPAPAKGPHAP
jgi:hypothetical protein